MNRNDLPIEFVRRMEAELGSEAEAFFSCYEEGSPVRGLRINTLKITEERFDAIFPYATEKAETLSEGRVLINDVPHIGDDPYHIAGLYYMQEPSAMSVIEASDVHPGMTVLDLCAAPGGKSGGIAARLQGKGLLVSNEIVRSRAVQLARNLERLGVTNAIVTNTDPETIASTLPEKFERVIVDAPCSGEGMFRKDAGAISEWSPEHVKACAVRQKNILESAIKALAPGGKLVYSTCTFSRDENEDIIDWLLRTYPDLTVEFTERLYPHKIKGEGHFAARLRKDSIINNAEKGQTVVGKIRAKNKIEQANKPFSTLNRIEQEAIEKFFKSLLTKESISRIRTEDLIKRNDTIVYVPFINSDDSAIKCISEKVLSLPVIAVGTELGVIKKHGLSPSHSFFMSSMFSPLGCERLSFKSEARFAAGSPALLDFLRGNAVIPPSDAELHSGDYAAVTVDGFAIGFAKFTDGILKNHLPKGLLIH